MELFEAKLSEMTTKDNNVYMEAVAQMYNVLFEAEVSVPKFDDRHKLMNLVMPMVDAATSLNKNDYLSAYTGGNQTGAPATAIRLINERVDDPTISDAEFYKTVVNACDKMLDCADITDPDAFNEGFAKFVVAKCDPAYVKAIRQSLITYLEQAQELNTTLEEFKNAEGKAMAKRTRVPRKKKPETIEEVPEEVSDETSAEPTVEPASGEQPATTATPAVKATKGKGKKSVKEEKKETEEPPDYSSIPVDTVLTDVDGADTRLMFQVPPAEAQTVVDYLKDSWHNIVQARYRLGLTEEPITITADPDGKVTISYAQSGTSMKLISRFRIAMYCLYCDLLRNGPVKIAPKAPGSEMTYAVADSILHDRKVNAVTLTKLFPQYIESLGNGKRFATLTADQVENAVTGINFNDVADQYILGALIAYGQETNSDTFPHGGSYAKNKAKFDAQISTLALKQYNIDNSSSDEAALSENKVSPAHFAERVRSFRDDNGMSLYSVFEQMYSELSTSSDDENEEEVNNEVAPASYDDDAARVVTACKNHVVNHDTMHYVPVNQSEIASKTNQVISDLSTPAPKPAAPVETRTDEVVKSGFSNTPFKGLRRPKE